MKMPNWRRYTTRSLSKIAFSVTAAAISIAGTTAAAAQIGSGGSSFGGVDQYHDVGAGIFGHRMSRTSADTGGPVGPELGRLPVVSIEEIPLGGFGEAAGELGTPGVSTAPLFGSDAYGTATEQWPYSHQRVAVYGNPGPSTYSFQVPVTSRPYRFAGKLRMRFGSTWYVCTASLIKKGVLITAAHCVHNYGNGAGGFANEVRWYPANYNSAGGPWGYYTAQNLYVPAPYVNGTDTCQSGAIGVVCNNDIATVVLQIRNGLHAGAAMGGWYTYGWNGYSYPTSSAFGNSRVASITQLGYPVAWDGGYQMQRNNSFGKLITGTGTNGMQLLNTQLGSSLSGGSSGGPWIVNFGTYPVLTNSSDASYGSQSTRNVVVGTTSWGYINKDINVQGASWFGQNAEYPGGNYGGRGAGNIGALVNTTCTAVPTHC